MQCGVVKKNVKSKLRISKDVNQDVLQKNNPLMKNVSVAEKKQNTMLFGEFNTNK